MGFNSVFKGLNTRPPKYEHAIAMFDMSTSQNDIDSPSKPSSLLMHHHVYITIESSMFCTHSANVRLELRVLYNAYSIQKADHGDQTQNILLQQK